MGYIYLITNKKNGKKYIGKTVNSIEKRFEGHLYNSKNGDTFLYKSIRKYGKTNFIIEEVEKTPDDNLDEREKYYIKEYNTLIPYGYNITEGGTGGDTSKSPKYIKSMKNRDMSGTNNPMYGKRGKDNPKYGKKYGKKPKISEGQKKNWSNNIERKKNASERNKGEKNPMFGKKPPNSVKIQYNGITYESLSDAVKKTGITLYFIKKCGVIIYND